MAYRVKKYRYLLTELALLSSFLLTINVNAENYNELTVEELRIEKAEQAMNNVVNRLDSRVNKFALQLSQARNLTALTQLVIRHGESVWREAVESFNHENDFDDRALYWARLKMTRALRQTQTFKSLLPTQQQKLMWKFELLSRGQQDVKFDRGTAKKILVTGFDPFFLDKHINQSNPSGAVALAFDDLVISKDGQSAEIETLIVPVRFTDFDQGMIEELLTPYIKQYDVDMVVTVSMGREHFDLERFPGLRRSANAPDNLNVYTGANGQRPLQPLLKGEPLKGPEFVQFSLPSKAMMAVQSPFKVNDNHKVTTLTSTITPKNLKALANQTSVQGSGGGYLSNEISYRSILLRNLYNPVLPVGHIHTPRLSGFDAKTLKEIVQQTKAMLTEALPST
ncbi:hypothetical protein AAD001_17520 [Colwelliaceae bacterium 6471]